MTHTSSNNASDNASDTASDTRSYTLAELPALVGQVLGASPWIQIDQARIDAFAHATGDLQWIHVDPARAAAGPFGTTIAHGFLTLSLLPWMGEAAFAISDQRMGVNYGLNKVRFPAPVPVGSRLQGEFRLTACEPVDHGGLQLTAEVTIRREGSAKPVCVAESVSRRYP
ncbi:MaoC family dehydratase [Sphaerotilus microaerophilus]|uniref:MaoC family dehydratase n=1 Tax=Sphaerotilus microaerophilus TaxID=2914710 RepID=A0ABM7YIC3_9BURK|nr:MaoC family dehydratase [Sphaerotilus sp. FB-5]BDI03960.1 MaoC family dehydratase [Sphaerotilus sp. FB-5]